eukprot:gene16944-biopygen4807
MKPWGTSAFVPPEAGRRQMYPKDHSPATISLQANGCQRSTAQHMFPWYFLHRFRHNSVQFLMNSCHEEDVLDSSSILVMHTPRDMSSSETGYWASG